MLALVFIRETRDVNLQDLDQAETDLTPHAGVQKALSN
jgi:hypothetical protein